MGCDNCTCGDNNCESPIVGMKRTVKGDFLGGFIDEYPLEPDDEA